MNVLSEYISELTTEDRKGLADRMGTTPAGLHQIHKAYRKSGRLEVSPELAARIEFATRGSVKREDCCTICRECDLAKKARGVV